MTVQTLDPRQIFLEAVEKVARDRWPEFLASACGADAALRERVEALLNAHGQFNQMLDGEGIVATLDRTVSEGPGTQIGPYKLLQQIGEGGFGVVFMAEQTEPVRRRVALKVIKPGMDTRQVIARFEAERQALALMDHPNIAKVLDAGATGEGTRNQMPGASSSLVPGPRPLAPSCGRPYFVMELVRGIPITDFCDRNHVSVRQRLALFVSVAQAIQHAHQKGVIHRDIKPSNVLVTLHDGVPIAKVIDFGIAKAAGQQLTEKTLFTNFAQMIGTPLYMSPEQAEMSGLDVDTRSDIYSLGVLLYELLTGTTPFDKERLKKAGYDEIRRIIREDEPARPSARVSTLGEAAATVSANRGSDPRRLSRLIRGELDWIVMKCLEKDRSRRYETASALVADVQRYLNDEPVQACPPSAAYRFRKFARRNKAALATAATMAVGVLMAVGSLAGAVYVLADSNAEVKAEQKQTKAALDREKETNDQLLQALDRVQWTQYFQRIALAERETEARNVGRAEELLEECPAPLRGWEWHYLKRLCRQEPFVFRGHPGLVNSVAVSPDGKMIASTSLVPAQGEVRLSSPVLGIGEIRIWERATGKLLHRLLDHRGPVGVAFHPDGKILISAGGDKTLRAWDVATGKQVRDQNVPAGAVACLAISPDGRLLVTGNADNTLRVWDAADFQELRTLRGHTGLVHAVAFGPDGRLVSGSFDGTVRVWDAGSGAEVHTLRGHAGPVFGADFSRDGTRVASCGLDGTTRVWDARTGRHVQTMRAEGGGTIGVAFSPDGRRLATSSLAKVIRVWDLQADKEALTLRGHTDVVWGVTFSPDGDQLVSFSLDGTARVWDATPLSAAAAPGERTLRGHTGAVLGVSFRPGRDRFGRVILASASQDQTVRLWDLATGEATGTLHGHAGPVESVSFSRDGRRVAATDFFGTVKVWDADTGKEVRTFHGTVARVALSPDGKRLAFSGEVGTVQVRDVDTGAEMLAPFPAHAGPVMYLAFSRDGSKLATGSWDQTAAVWDSETGRRLHTLSGHQHAVVSVEFSEDGSRLVTASWDKTPKLWDATTGNEIRTFIGHEDNVSSAALSSDGQWLASASSDNTVRVWDANTGDVVAVLRGHTGHVMSVAFSLDGKWLASSSGYRGKGEVKVWDATWWEKKSD